MKDYELIYLHKVTDNETIKRFNDELQKILEENNGILVDIALWGEKNLACEIKNETRGFYTKMKFQCSKQCLELIDEKLKQKEELLNFVIFTNS